MRNLKITILNTMLKAAVISALALAAGCGGGGSAAPAPGQNPGGAGPAAGRADLSGQLVQSGDARVSSAAGAGLQGLIVALINTASGQLAASDVTDSLGKFEFKGVPSGDQYLVKVEFKSTNDLDGDGRLDDIELFFPVSLADQAVVALLQQIGVSDSDGDGQLDALNVEVSLSDDRGNSDSSRRQHRRRSGETREDSNGNGSFSDDRGFDDSDCDGIPDSSTSGGSLDDSSAGLFGLEVKGAIESISSSSITVSGVSFALTSATTWRIDDNRNANPAQFTVGTFVEVEGFRDGSGGWIATKVKTEDDFGTGGGSGGDDSPAGFEREVKGFIEAISADSITVGGVTFALTGSTTWRIGDNRSASPSAFSVGMFVEVEGPADGQGGWIAKKVKTEDDFSGGGSGGGGSTDDDGTPDQGSGDDDGTPDQGGGNDDDGSGDDNGGDDDSGSDDDDDDDNSGSDDDDDDDDNSGKGRGGDDD